MNSRVQRARKKETKMQSIAQQCSLTPNVCVCFVCLLVNWSIWTINQHNSNKRNGRCPIDLMTIESTDVFATTGYLVRVPQLCVVVATTHKPTPSLKKDNQACTWSSSFILFHFLLRWMLALASSLSLSLILLSLPPLFNCSLLSH